MWFYLIFFLVLVCTKHNVEGDREAADDVSFDQNYVVRYGNDHVLQLNQGRDVQLSLDQTTGSNC